MTGVQTCALPIWWTADTVRQRFHYRTPGLYVLPVTVFRLPHPVDVVERPEYAGCKTWVELDTPIPTDGAVRVLDAVALHDYFVEFDRLL